jgi:hypothetical protein
MFRIALNIWFSSSRTYNTVIVIIIITISEV